MDYVLFDQSKKSHFNVKCGVFQMTSSKSLLSDPGRPVPMPGMGIQHMVKHKYFPDSVDKIPLTKA